MLKYVEVVQDWLGMKYIITRAREIAKRVPVLSYFARTPDKD